jgi:arginyl-tRNA synthetase
MDNDLKKNATITDLLSRRMRAIFEQAFPDSGQDFSTIAVTATANPEFGDYQCNAAMALSKFLKKQPRDIAQAAVNAAPPSDAIERLEIAGPGFINIYLKTEWLTQFVDGMLRDERLGVPAVGGGKTVILDYGGPNICKPLHIGHLRTHNIGGALDRLYRFLGYHVVSDSHLGDWGTQFGIIIMGYRHFADPKALDEKPVEELERVYVESHKKGEEDEAWKNQCRQELVKLQAGDPENRALWQKFVSLSLREVDRLYQRLGISFDLVRGESYYNDRLKGVVDLLTEKGLARESEGAMVVFLDEEKLPVCMVRKTDGGYLYATTDIATVLSRVEEFNPERVVYVTDERQQGHLKQVFAVCRRLGVATRFDHVWFGLMRLPEGTFSTREGNVIKLERLLDEAEARALEMVKKSSPDMDPARQKDVARAVGIGAVKYADLSQNPQTLVTFTWEKALSLEGNSAPYLQYAYARIDSVRDKYAERFLGKDPDTYPLRVVEPIERTLAIQLVRFPETVIYAAHNYKPSSLADYLYALCQTYSTFYQNVPFLKAEEGIRESRVRLCGIVARVLGQGLRLLGIETPDRI